ncbi:MAG: PKD domain-containing protein [Flavitalea sp.]
MTIKAFLSFTLILLAFAAGAQSPAAEFTTSQVSGCAPLSVAFRDASTGDPKFWNWDFGNGQISNVQNPTVNYTTPGTYSVTLVVRNGSGTNGITKNALITVFESPRASFSLDRTNVCVPSTVNFTDLSTDNSGTIVSYLWNFGDGTTSTERNPSHSYAQAGFYTVDLTITSSSGCTSRSSRFRAVRVFNGVEADFITPAAPTCQPPFAMRFENQTSGPGTLTYSWNLGNNTSSTLEDPSTVYNTPGTYQVSLTATSSFGCSSTIQKEVTINGYSTTFSSPDSICIGSTASFTNTSTQTPTSFYWEIGNERDTTLSPSRNFPVAGTYPIKLVQDFGNCRDSLTRNLVVNPKPVLNFTSSDTIACRIPATINFTDQTPNAATWTWNFGDGTTSSERNPSHIYTGYGRYNVTLIVTDRFGCTDTLVRNGYINIEEPVVTIRNAPAGGCAPFIFSPVAEITSLEPITSYFWESGNGQTSTSATPTFNYIDSGTYNLKLRITTASGCTDSIEIVNGIRVGRPIPVDFAVSNPSSCASNAVNFTDLSIGSTAYSWTFGDGGTSSQKNPSYTYTDTGSFSVTFTAFNNGCGSTIVKNNIVNVRPPISNFDYTTNCALSTSVLFNNLSVVDNSLSVSYLWNFGDPSNSIDSVANPTFIFPGPGTYNVSLTTTNDTCSSTIILPVIITNERADFTSANQTYCSSTRFELEAININPDNIARYQWRYGNGPFITGNRTIGNRLTIPGTYDITLIITDINGCSDTLFRPGYITITGPIARFAVNRQEECTRNLVTFLDSTVSPAAIVNWNWNFGDGTIRDFTSGPFTHSYTDTGTYNVVLTVRDVNGCESQFGLTNAIHVSNASAGFYSDTTIICPGLPVNFRDSSAGENLQYLWDFGDGQTSADAAPSHLYPDINGVSYTVKLNVTNSFGCSDSLIRTNYISIRKPIAGISTRDTITLCPPLESIFVYTGSGEETVYWDMGDGTDPLYGDTVRHFYNEYGDFTVTQYSVGFGGCVDSAKQQVRVINPNTTQLNYSPVDACNRLLVDFEIVPPPASRFTLFFGDGTSDTTQNRNVQHFYGAPAFYNPTLQLLDPIGCLVNVGGSRPIRIIGAIPLFGVDRTEFCDTGRVFFTNYTIGNDPVTGYVWDFGDGTTSTEKDEIHFFSRPGTYVVSLTVNTRSGCSDITYDTINVYPTPVTNILSRDTICVGESAAFLGSLINGDNELVE